MGFVAVARDVTERKRAEEELRKHRNHLEELVAERSSQLQTANEQLRRELARRKRAEKALKLSEVRYRALFEEAADPFVLVDVETGALVEFNQRAHQDLGYSREEFEKLTLCDIDVVDSAEDVAARIQKTATEGTHIFETKQRTKSGEIRDIQIAAGALSIHGRKFIQSVWHDITERKRTEERLAESEERYRSLVELSPDTVAVQCEGKIVFINNAGARLLGAANVEQLLGMPVADFLHPDYRETVAERLRKAAEEGTSPSLIEQKFIRLDGTDVDVEVAAMPLTYQGKPAMQIVARDITERKQAEEALRRSEERYRTILEEMEDSYFETDLAGSFAFVNDATCHSLGYPRDEVIHMGYRRYVADEDVETVYRAFNRVYRTGKPRRSFSYKVARKDGSTGFVEISVFPVRNKEGDITGFRGIGRDVTERKRVEEALWQSEARFRDVAENCLEWIWEVDVEGKYTYASVVVKAVLGYEPEEVLDRCFYEFFFPEDREQLKEAVFEIFSRKVPFRGFINRVMHKSGKTVWLSTSGVPMLDEEGDLLGYRGADADITEQKEAEARISDSLAEKKVLLREIHHRVKNNMQLISSLLDVSSDHVKDAEVLHMLEESQNRVRSIALIHDKLYQSEDLARIDFDDYIRDLTDDLLNLYTVNRSVLKLEIDVDNVFLDVNKAIPCGLIINELVSNCLKHAFPNGRDGETRIGLHSDRDSGHTLVVSDNGIGIPDLDFRNTATGGLQLVTTLVEQLEGTMEIDRNGGTTFTIKW